ncbi:MAG TPA: thioredoxin-like domain-containing protein [Gemmataceae bacterium]|nr:thioredoxin-like domain-containing protein [Gemmataceae bacterium]
MLRARVSAGTITGCLLVWGAVAQAAPPPGPEIFLRYRPRQEGVLYGTPDAKDVAACKVEPEKGKDKGAGWLLRDPQGRPLRRFYDTQYDGVNKTTIDVWSYYQDGVETYREQFVNTAADPDQMNYRWLNQGGSKWGTAHTKDGKIDTWKVISPEEVSQEIVLAIVKNEFARIQALMISDAELKALDPPADLARRARDGRAAAAARFKETVNKLALNDKSHWLHLETEAPHLIPVERGRDILEHAHGTIVIETAAKNDWIQTGEMIQVGPGWRLIEAPTAGAIDGKAGPMGGDNPELQKLLTDLGALNGDFSKKPDAKPAEVLKYNLERSTLIEKIIAAVKSDEERGQWIRQEADCLSAAAQNSPADDKAAYERLTSVVGQVKKAMPAGDALTAYVTFREMQAWYYDQTRQKDYDFKKVHEAWLERLGKYAKDHPTSEDAPEAILSAGWVSETLGKEVEAKNWYQQLAKDFPDKPQGAKAKGAIRRLGLEGTELALAGPTLDGGTFDVSKLHGKVVVVYYWYSFNGGPVGEFAKLKLLLDTYAVKGLELVTVNLDSSAKEASDFVKKTNAPGTHLYQEGGMDSKYAVEYGVMMLPNLFLVGKDGKVVSRTLQIGNVEEEIKKQVAK